MTPTSGCGVAVVASAFALAEAENFLLAIRLEGVVDRRAKVLACCRSIRAPTLRASMFRATPLYVVLVYGKGDMSINVAEIELECMIRVRVFD